ncbi:MAG: ribonuclease P protein component [Lachnospira sp.]|nr:ribonuclease P protein component [Lachnospira sp.]
MKNYVSLKNNNEFRMVYAKGRVYSNKFLVMYILENGTDIKRLGISVSKKVGNSIVRHRLTRLIRETFRLNKDKLIEGIDIVVVAKVNLKDKDYYETESAFMHLSKLHRIIKRDDNND